VRVAPAAEQGKDAGERDGGGLAGGIEGKRPIGGRAADFDMAGGVGGGRIFGSVARHERAPAVERGVGRVTLGAEAKPLEQEVIGAWDSRPPARAGRCDQRFGTLLHRRWRQLKDVAGARNRPDQERVGARCRQRLAKCGHEPVEAVFADSVRSPKGSEQFSSADHPSRVSGKVEEQLHDQRLDRAGTFGSGNDSLRSTHGTVADGEVGGADHALLPSCSSWLRTRLASLHAH
jgi:hypothetical protein